MHHTTETETDHRLRAIRDAIRAYRDTSPEDAGHMPAQRARASVTDTLRECDAVIADALFALADEQLVACDGGCGRVLQPRRVVDDHDDSWCRECVAREADRYESAYDDARQRGQRNPRAAVRS